MSADALPRALASVLLLACAAMAAPVAAADAGAPKIARSWNFRVYLNQDLIGSHDFTLTDAGEMRELKSSAHFQVRILFINAYHYDHQATEIWRGDCLQRLDSTTDHDGRKLAVHITPPGCVMSFAYWNPLMLQQQHLIDPETGEDIPVTISLIGEEPLTVRGAALHARHYHLHSPKLEIDLWYSLQGDWLALQSPSEKGRLLRYVLN